MATGKRSPGRPRTPTRPNRPRLILWGLVGLAALGLLYVVFSWPAISAQAQLGARYAARMGCSCRYIEGRTLDSCRSDFEPGMALVSLDEEPGERRVSARVPLIASASARYTAAAGCQFEGTL